jgi:8-oxo-dGTP pyrophosphatase MutT (NUDIX family)
VSVEVRNAATVLVLRDSHAGPEVFMVRRHDRAVFMGGAHVFPGGAVDAADREAADPEWCEGLEHAAAEIPDVDRADALALHVAAVRELFEEAGVLLARGESGEFVSLKDGASRTRFQQSRQDIHAGRETLRDLLDREHLRLALDALTICAHWVTPPLDLRRFDTRFFVARLPAEQQPAHDERETTESRWTTPAAAIEAARRREIILPSPTWATLRELEPARSVDEALEWARGRDVRRREPQLIESAEGRMLVLPGDPLSPESGLAPPAYETRFVWKGDRWLPE